MSGQTRRERAVLRVIDSRDYSLSAKGIGRRSGMTEEDTERTLFGLLQRGLVARKGYLWTITNEGRAVLVGGI